MRKVGTVLMILVLMGVAGCAAGPGSQWTAEDAPEAGFWAGLWHGILLLVTLIVSFFTDQVRIYETHNSGLGYDIGFVLGMAAVYGSGVKVTVGSKRRSGEDFGQRVEAKIKAKVERLVEDEEEWKELGEKVERKIKEKLRRWLDEDK
ncbi:MAG: hypothetical protein ACYSUN_02505 [Planctomycetota bacterium]|jgi:hypothetical protein